MLKVSTETAQPGGGGRIRLAGSIDETDDLRKLLGRLTGNVTLHCRGVTAINSRGVRAWIIFFDEARKHAQLRFEEVAVTLVEMANSIQNFLPTSEIVSVMVPYLCISCAANLEAPIKVADIQAAKQKIPDSKCPKCGAKAVFDDHPEEYFIFLNR